jgi:endonuclease G, mitochondrial
MPCDTEAYDTYTEILDSLGSSNIYSLIGINSNVFRIGENIMNDITIEIPLRITFSVSAPVAPGASTAQPVIVAATSLERVDIDPNYANRKGYDPNFLGVSVPLPVLNEEQRRNAAKNSMARPGEDNAVLPYHHFSIVMNRRRQLA